MKYVGEDSDRLGFELSLRVVMFHEALAQRLGVNRTEHKLLDLVARHPDGLTPGELATATGLSNPAITKVVDALAARDLVRRERSTTDRRSVRVLLAPGHAALTRPSAAGVARRIHELNESFTGAELDAITRWVEGVNDALRAETEALRGD